MSEQPPRIVIIGAGHAGGSAAAFLRQYGWKGAITLIGAEPALPYQRPPLSKAWLKGEATAESLALRPARFYQQQSIDLRLGARVVALDAVARRVTLGDGTVLDYEHAILATGAVPRRLTLPGADLAGVIVLRDMAEAEALRARLTPGHRLVVIGGGYVGLEVAASAIGLGAAATVLEREARVLARVAGADLAAFLAAAHRARGVVVETGVDIVAIEGRDGAAVAVRLADGRAIPADTVLVGIGAAPDVALAADCGLDVTGGIQVDAAARTALPHLYAVGDCTRRPIAAYGRMGRLESVPNAIEQAKQAAADITGRAPPPAELPWFWSDQFDLRLQIAGLADGATQAVQRGDPAGGSFAVFHLGAEGRILALEAVNAPADFMAGRALVAAGARIAPALLADPAQDLRSLAA